MQQIANGQSARVPNILIVGDLMLDKYWHTDVTRISPEAPIPVSLFKSTDARGGGAANVAINCASLGVNVKLLGITGDDTDAHILRGILKESNIDLIIPPQSEYSTIWKLRILSGANHLLRVDNEKKLSNSLANLLVEYFEEHIAQCDIVIFSDYAKGSLKLIQKMILVAKKAGKRILVDPKGADIYRYKGADIITPNYKEFEALFGECLSERQIIEKATNWCNKVNIGGILITRGELGMLYVDANEQVLSIPSRATRVFDVTGAGDTVIAVLAVALVEGKSLKQSLEEANFAAGLVVKQSGTASVKRAEMEKRLDDRNFLESKIITVGELKRIRNEVKLDGKKFVMTNGCFDILHDGHVAYLEEASHLGDILAVAIDSDESVKELKGDERPINTLQSRLRQIAALSSVDWVIAFEGNELKEIYEQILPDILVKGKDYTAKNIIGAEPVTLAGGEVKLMNFKKGYSTSSIIEKLKGKKT